MLDRPSGKRRKNTGKSGADHVGLLLLKSGILSIESMSSEEDLEVGADQIHTIQQLAGVTRPHWPSLFSLRAVPATQGPRGGGRQAGREVFPV